MEEEAFMKKVPYGWYLIRTKPYADFVFLPCALRSEQRAFEEQNSFGLGGALEFGGESGFAEEGVVFLPSFKPGEGGGLFL